LPAVSATLEDYLESILNLQRQSPVTRVKDIAKALSVRMPSVTAALRSLKTQGLIRHEKYGYVELTAEGRDLAEQIHRRHIALVDFLTDILQLQPEQSEAEACELEHSLRPETLRRLLGSSSSSAGAPAVAATGSTTCAGAGKTATATTTALSASGGSRCPSAAPSCRRR